MRIYTQVRDVGVVLAEFLPSYDPIGTRGEPNELDFNPLQWD